MKEQRMSIGMGRTIPHPNPRKEISKKMKIKKLDKPSKGNADKSPRTAKADY